MILQILLFASSELANSTEPEKSWAAENMPWVAALIIAVLTVLTNILISRWQTKNALNSLKLQVSTSKEISEQEIKRDIRSSNRMVWISDLRNAVSNYIGNHEYIKLIAQHDSEPRTGTPTPEFKQGFKEWLTLSYRIELLLNPDEDKSKDIKRLMTELNIATDYRSLSKEEDYERIKNQILSITKAILKEEWERVKNLE